MDTWLAADWPALPGVVAGTTLRTAGDFGARAALQDDGRARAALARQLDCDLIGWLQQVHGVDVVQMPSTTDLPVADASWTRVPGIGCVVLTADCLPVLLASEDGQVVGAAHAGWRGLCEGVLEATLGALQAATSAPLQAWLGPAIGPQAFEVGPEVRTAFLNQDAAAEAAFRPGMEDRWWADLYLLARQRLVRAGMAVERIHGGGACTRTDAGRFHSYRRDGASSGRMASVIARR